MKKLITLIVAFTLAANASPRLDGIPNASYAIFEGGKEPGLRLKDIPNKKVTFYTFDGNSIVTVPLHLAYHVYGKVMSLRLDPSAPTPQPVTYEIKPASKIHGLFKSGKCIIIFYDKHENVIAEFECYKKSDSISISCPNEPERLVLVVEFSASNFEMLRALIKTFGNFPLDLSLVTEKPKHSKN